MTAPPQSVTVTAVSTIGLCLAVAVVFQPILAGGFFLDDLVRLYDLANFGLAKLLLSPHGGHLLLASNGVYAAFWSLFGLEPRRWFAAVVALHALNTVLLFSTLRRFGCRDLVALAMAAVWGLCPVQAGSVGWMAVFGHVLLGTIMLVWIRDVATVAGRGVPIQTWRLGLWWALGLLAATSFGIGLGLAGALPFAAVCLLPGTPNRRRVGVVLGGLLVVVPMLYLAQHAVYERLYPVAPFMAPTLSWGGDPSRVVARGAEVVWHLVDFVTYALGVLLLGSLGAIPPLGAPGSGVGPAVQLMWLMLPAAALLALATWALRQAPSTRRWQAFGVGLLALAGYASVSIGGLSSTDISTRLLGFSRSAAIAFKTMAPRYHYVPTLFLATLLAFAAEAAATRPPPARYVTTAALCGMLVWLCLRAYWDRSMIVAFVSPDMFGRETHLLASGVQRLRDTDPTYLPNAGIGAGYVYLHSEQFPGQAALCVIAHPDGVVHGRTVRFVERNPDVLAAIRAQGDTPISRLVVSPAEAPPGGW